MDVYVLGVALHPAAERVSDKRLEEMVFDTTRAALDAAGVTRKEIDQVTIAACDELDGRSISSMLLATPAGAYMKDEIKCTDSGLVGLCLGALRMESALFDLGLVVSWNKSSTAPVEDVMRMRAEPFFTRPIGVNMAITDALFAGAVARTFGIADDAVNERVVAACRRAERNPRGMCRPVPSMESVARSPFVATPLKTAQRAPLTDGAVAMVLASRRCVERRPDAQPLARISGMGWAVDGYQLGAGRLGGLGSFRSAFRTATSIAGLGSVDALDVIELDCPTGYHEAAFAAALGGARAAAISPSGGAFAQHPYFCSGLVNAAEAVLQVAGRAGAVQVPGARRAAAHGCHGFAQQGNVAVIVEGV